jgi:DnaJ-class molecular chaperone
MRADMAREFHLAANGVGRADRKLRKFPRRGGDAVMCRLCDGDGVILLTRANIDPIRKCTRCGGEGLEPPE